MKLLRRFKWEDRATVYLPVDEGEVERLTGGMIRFTAVAVDGTRYAGAAFESTVSAMVDAKPYWKLAENPKKPEKSIVVDVAGVPLAKSIKSSSRALKEKSEIDGLGD